MGRAGLEPALLQQELGPKPSAYANFATCPFYTETKIIWPLYNRPSWKDMIYFIEFELMLYLFLS